jgi:hypothetical protein
MLRKVNVTVMPLSPDDVVVWNSRLRQNLFSRRQHHVQNGSGAHPASYPVGTGGSFPGDKAAGA